MLGARKFTLLDNQKAPCLSAEKWHICRVIWQNIQKMFISVSSTASILKKLPDIDQTSRKLAHGVNITGILRNKC